jgi:hypothetical protein
MTGPRYVVEGAEPHCTVVDLAQPDKPGPRYRTHADAQAEADRLNTPKGPAAVGEWSRFTKRDTPADLAEDRGVADHHSGLAEGGYCR